MPLLIAGLFCFAVAALLGYFTWSIFGYQARERGDTARFLAQFGLGNGNLSTDSEMENSAGSEAKNSSENSNRISDKNLSKTDTELTPRIEGVLPVEGGEFAVGGGETQRPLQRIFVENFQIAETEVTNAQYAEFIKDSGHRSPIGWNGAEYPEGTQDYPVVNVSWDDANAFCEWMSEKYKMKFRNLLNCDIF